MTIKSYKFTSACPGVVLISKNLMRNQLLNDMFKGEILIYETMSGRTFERTRRLIRMWNGVGAGKEDGRCLNCAFQFRTEASGKSLSLSFSASVFPRNSLLAAWCTGNSESRKVQNMKAKRCGSRISNEIVRQVQRSNLWNNKYCRESNTNCSHI
jgi:hypothetical protein